MKPIHVLLVEDNEGDIFLTTEALEDGKIVNKISIARDGKEAIQFLEDRLSTATTELPDLILLDVNLPIKNGHEVLHFDGVVGWTVPSWGQCRAASASAIVVVSGAFWGEVSSSCPAIAITVRAATPPTSRLIAASTR